MKRRALCIAAITAALFATSAAGADEGAPAPPAEVAEAALVMAPDASSTDGDVCEDEVPSAGWWELPLRSDGTAERCECQKGDPLCGCIEEPQTNADDVGPRDALLDLTMPTVSSIVRRWMDRLAFL